MGTSPPLDKRQQIAQFRFSIISQLLSRPPEKGDLAHSLRQLASKSWIPPWEKDVSEHFSKRTLERWHSLARNAQDPIKALMPRCRKDIGEWRALSLVQQKWIRESYQNANRISWSYQLHSENLAVAIPEPKVSYSSVLRFMKAAGMLGKGRKQRTKPRREMRTFEVEFVGELLHMDFHECSRAILTPAGEWVKPKCVAFIDDNSRLAFHCQWYLNETTEVLVHSLSQAFLKRGLPRTFYSDCGSAMRGTEFEAGLHRLGIKQERTLPYSPWQNGKQECFWQPLEGRLVKQIPRSKPLTLEVLNQFTQAWVEQDYHQNEHSEIKTTPFKRFLHHKNVLRKPPTMDFLKRAFRKRATREQRKSDGTVTLDGVRFEVPQAYRHIKTLELRYAHWDLSQAELLCPQTSEPLCDLYPQNKVHNAQGERPEISSDLELLAESLNSGEAQAGTPLTLTDESLPPLLQKWIAEFTRNHPLPTHLNLKSKE